MCVCVNNRIEQSFAAQSGKRMLKVGSLPTFHMPKKSIETPKTSRPEPVSTFAQAINLY